MPPTGGFVVVRALACFRTPGIIFQPALIHTNSGKSTMKLIDRYFSVIQISLRSLHSNLNLLSTGLTRSAGSDTAHQEQDKEHKKYSSGNATGPVTPTATVRPGRNDTHENQHQDDQ
jgi:hypothetical protein